MAHPSFFGVARMAETMVGRIIIRVVGRKNGMMAVLELEQEQQKVGVKVFLHTRDISIFERTPRKEL